MGQKKKGGFFQRLIMGTEKAEGYARSTLPSNRWELFWDIFKGRFWKLVLINLMLVVGCAGIIFCFFNLFANNVMVGTNLPYGQNLGMGFPYVEGLDTYAIQFRLQVSNMTFLLLIPSFLLLGVVASGVFYIMRNLVWTEGVFIANDFWRGLRQNIVQMLFLTLIYALFLWMSNFSLNQISWMEFNGQGNFWLSFSRVGIYIVMVLLTIMLLYGMSISVTYKLKFFQLIKNSFLLAIGLLPQNLFFVFLMVCPVLLCLLLPMISSFVIIIYLLFGLSMAVLIWTNYSHWVFDKFINDRVEGAEKNKGIYTKVDVKGQPVAKKKKPGGFSNPKKKKRAPEPEPEITELHSGFSRADLERLDREKRALADAMRNNREEEEAEESEDGEEDEMREEDREEEAELSDLERLDGASEEDFDAAEVIDDALEQFEEDGSEGYEDALRLEGAEDEPKPSRKSKSKPKK